MLRWLASLTDSSPLGSVGGARKFAASLDRDIFSATDVVCAQLRAFISEAEHKETLAASPLLELDARLEATTTRLERDYLAASLQSHSLRERLWDSGYDWAMRFADAYRRAWDSPEAPPIGEYAAGTWGPEPADDLFHGCEGGWSQGRD